MAGSQKILRKMNKVVVLPSQHKSTNVGTAHGFGWKMPNMIELSQKGQPWSVSVCENQKENCSESILIKARKFCFVLQNCVLAVIQKFFTVFFFDCLGHLVIACLKVFSHTTCDVRFVKSWFYDVDGNTKDSHLAPVKDKGANQLFITHVCHVIGSCCGGRCGPAWMGIHGHVVMGVWLEVPVGFRIKRGLGSYEGLLG